MKALQIIESGYRCTIEEQDDPCLWITQNLKVTAGAEVDLLLRGNAVNYILSTQNASGLVFGSKKQTQPPEIDRDLLHAISHGIKVYVITEDLDARGISDGNAIAGITKISRKELPNLFEEYDSIWHW